MSELRDEPTSVEIVSSERVYDGAVWDIQREVFRYGDEELTREFVAHPGAAAVIALDDEDRVLLIQQYRHPIRHRDWEIPAGLLDVEGEPPLGTAQRELAEEADLVASEWQELVSIFTSPGGNDEIVHIFLARGLRPAPERFAREAEEADMRREWVALTDAVTAVLQGRMRNAILATGVLAAAAVRRRP